MTASSSPLLSEKSVIKEQVERKGDECHQKIVKRLMSHSQYYPSSNVFKVEPTSTLPTYQQHTISHYPNNYYYNNNNNDYSYSYQSQYQPPPYSSLSITPPLASPTIMNSFDQISSSSPQSSDYIFNGDLNFFGNCDLDLSFPFIDSTTPVTSTTTTNTSKSSQLFDNQTVEIKQLTPIKIQSLDDVGGVEVVVEEEKNSSYELANVDDHHTLLLPTLPSVASSINCWKFSEQQMTASY